MAVTLNNNTDCCESTCTNTTVNVAGPTGPAGAAGSNGTNGSNGVNAYARTSQNFTVPAVGIAVGLTVDNATPFMTGMIIFVQDAGYYEVTGTSTNTINAKNLGYAINAAVGATIGNPRLIVSAGIQGAAGSGGITYPSGFAQKGDLLTHDGSTYTDQAVGSANTQALFVDSTAGNGMTWRQPKFGDFNAATDKLNLATHTDTATQLALTQIGNAGGGAGDIAYWDATNWVRIPAGTNGQSLVYDTTLSRPKWTSSSSTIGVIAKGNITYTAGGGGSVTGAGMLNLGTLGFSFTGSPSPTEPNISCAFAEDLSTTVPTVLISPRNSNARDLWVESITTSGVGRAIVFKTTANVDLEFHFAVLDS